MEETIRHTHWHGRNATWYDVLTNKISVDRSSVGNALYLVLNLASSGFSANTKNFANVESWANPTTKAQEGHMQQSSTYNNTAQLYGQMAATQYSNNFNPNQSHSNTADAMYQLQLQQQQEAQNVFNRNQQTTQQSPFNNQQQYRF